MIRLRVEGLMLERLLERAMERGATFRRVERDGERSLTLDTGERGARINSISPGIIVTPLALDEFNGPRGDFYKRMFAQCPTNEVANVAELLMSGRGAFITGADFLIDGGATASYFYGPLNPRQTKKA